MSSLDFRSFVSISAARKVTAPMKQRHHKENPSRPKHCQRPLPTRVIAVAGDFQCPPTIKSRSVNCSNGRAIDVAAP
jgi:hypothetical protein